MRENRIISFCMALVMLAGAVPTTALAASTGSTANNTSIGQDIAQGAKTEYSTINSNTDTQTEVYLTADDSDLIVSVPTTIIVSGTPTTDGKYVGEYSVGVDGDMSGDKTVIIEPESTDVTIKQLGKNNKTATVTQNQTEFTSDDFANKKITNGKITAEGLTAGSWNGTFNFNISIVKMKRFYSSISLAAQDINQETLNTDETTADLYTVENAVCGVYKVDDTYRIEVFKDVEGQNSVSFEKNTKINLNNHTVSFTEKEGITYSSSFSVVNGTLNNSASNSFISTDASNTEGSLILNNVSINQSVPDTITSSVTAIKVYNQYIRVTNTILNQNGVGNSNYNVIGVTVLNTAANSNVYMEKFNYIADVTNAKNVVAMQKSSNLYCTDIDININTSTASVYGIYSIANSDNIIDTDITFTTESSDGYGILCTKSTTAVIDNVTINGSSSSGNLWGITDNTTHEKLEVKNSDITIMSVSGSTICASSNGENLAVSNCNIYASSKDVSKGAGIAGYNKTSFVIENCTVYGKQWAVQTPESATTTIKNCNISSTDHNLYVVGNADIYYTTLRIANRDKYTVIDEPYGVYCGSSSTDKKAIVNFHNCQIGSKEDNDQNSYNGVVTQAHYNGTYCPAEINLYDTDIYTTQRAFTFNIGSNDNPINTKFNLYGTGQIYVYNKSTKNFDVVSKDTLNDEVMTWKTILKEKKANGYCVYNRGVIYGNEIANVDETTNTIETLKVTNNANVYDYR